MLVRSAQATRFLFSLLIACVVAAPCAAASSSAAPARSTVDGALEIVVEDHPAFSRTRHFLKTTQGRIELQFARGSAPINLHAGARMRASGSLSGSVLMLTASDTAALAATAPAPLANTFGEQSVAVLLVNFSDDRSQPYTLAQTDDLVFNQLNGFLKENSFQQTWLRGSSFGWLQLPIAKTCDGGAIDSAGRQSAAAAGIDLSGYGRVMYVFPSNSACGWSGMANVGGASPAVWINGWLTLGNVGHEYGHTLGLRHAHSIDCGATTLGDTCTTWEYGDKIDIMGNTAPGHFDAFEKERLGWLNNLQQPTITTVQGSGRYTIEAYAAVPGGLPKALKIPRGIDPTTGATLWYYVEYRQPVGYDSALAAWSGSNTLNGLLVRSASGTDTNSGLLLDMTPNSSSFDDWADAALPFGQAYNDSASGVMIVPVTSDGHSAQVDVTLSAPAGCVRAVPGVAVAGPGTSVSAGSTLAYTVTVTNKDSVGCAASAFNLTTALPTGWSGNLAAGALTLGAGASAATTLTVASPAGAAAGSYGIGVAALNASAPSYVASGAATYTVVAASLGTSISTDKSSYRPGDTVNATATVFSGTSPVAGASVNIVFVRADGSSVTKKTTTDASGAARSSYKLGRRDPAGAWQVKDSASASGQPSAASSTAFTVQ